MSTQYTLFDLSPPAPQDFLGRILSCLQRLDNNHIPYDDRLIIFREACQIIAENERANEQKIGFYKPLLIAVYAKNFNIDPRSYFYPDFENGNKRLS